MSAATTCWPIWTNWKACSTYLARHGPTQSLKELAQHRLIHYVPAFGTRSAGFEYLTGSKLQQLPMAGPASAAWAISRSRGYLPHRVRTLMEWLEELLTYDLNT